MAEFLNKRYNFNDGELWHVDAGSKSSPLHHVVDPVYSLTLENPLYHAHIYRFVGETFKEAPSTGNPEENEDAKDSSHPVRTSNTTVRQETGGTETETVKRLQGAIEESLQEIKVLEVRLEQSKAAFDELMEDKSRLQQTLATRRWLTQKVVYPIVIAFLVQLIFLFYSLFMTGASVARGTGGTWLTKFWLCLTKRH